MIEALARFFHDPCNMMGLRFSGFAIEVEGFGDRPMETVWSIVLEKKTVSGVEIIAHGGDGIVNSAGIVRDAESAVFRADHLRKAARFETRGHDHKIRTRIAEAGEWFAETSAMPPALAERRYARFPMPSGGM